MTKAKKKTEKNPAAAYRVELVTETKRGQKRLTKYEGDDYEALYACINVLREGKYPHIEVTFMNKNIVHVYTRLTDQQNYRLCVKILKK